MDLPGSIFLLSVTMLPAASVPQRGVALTRIPNPPPLAEVGPASTSGRLALLRVADERRPLGRRARDAAPLASRSAGACSRRPVGVDLGRRGRSARSTLGVQVGRRGRAPAASRTACALRGPAASSSTGALGASMASSSASAGARRPASSSAPRDPQCPWRPGQLGQLAALAASTCRRGRGDPNQIEFTPELVLTSPGSKPRVLDPKHDYVTKGDTIEAFITPAEGVFVYLGYCDGDEFALYPAERRALRAEARHRFKIPGPYDIDDDRVLYVIASRTAVSRASPDLAIVIAQSRKAMGRRAMDDECASGPGNGAGSQAPSVRPTNVRPAATAIKVVRYEFSLDLGVEIGRGLDGKQHWLAD
jgi:hypothetical protein